MTRSASIVALLLVLVIGLQMAACLASGDCLQLTLGLNLAPAASPSDCDGCGCCHLHPGFQITPPVFNWTLNAFLPPTAAANAPERPALVPHRPPRA